jgi:hypothetical protein
MSERFKAVLVQDISGGDWGWAVMDMEEIAISKSDSEEEASHRADFLSEFPITKRLSKCLWDPACCFHVNFPASDDKAKEAAVRARYRIAECRCYGSDSDWRWGVFDGKEDKFAPFGYGDECKAKSEDGIERIVRGEKLPHWLVVCKSSLRFPEQDTKAKEAEVHKRYILAEKYCPDLGGLWRWGVYDRNELKFAQFGEKDMAIEGIQGIERIAKGGDLYCWTHPRLADLRFPGDPSTQAQDYEVVEYFPGKFGVMRDDGKIHPNCSSLAAEHLKIILSTGLSIVGGWCTNESLVAEAAKEAAEKQEKEDRRLREARFKPVTLYRKDTLEERYAILDTAADLYSRTSRKERERDCNLEGVLSGEVSCRVITFRTKEDMSQDHFLDKKQVEQEERRKRFVPVTVYDRNSGNEWYAVKDTLCNSYSTPEPSKPMRDVAIDRVVDGSLNDLWINHCESEIRRTFSFAPPVRRPLRLCKGTVPGHAGLRDLVWVDHLKTFGTITEGWMFGPYQESEVKVKEWIDPEFLPFKEE